jgi:hypothetical protein
MDLFGIDGPTWLATGLGCLGALALIGLLAAAGFALRLVRGERLGRSLAFAIGLVAIPLLCPGLIAAAATGSVYWSASLAGDSATAEGRVIRLEERDTADGSGFVAIVEFVTAGDVTVEFEDGTVADPPQYAVGQQVTVLYNRNNPRQAIIQSLFNLWGLPAVLGLVTLVCLGLAVGLAYRSYRAGHYWGPLEELVDVFV